MSITGVVAQMSFSIIGICDPIAFSTKEKMNFVAAYNCTMQYSFVRFPRRVIGFGNSNGMYSFTQQDTITDINLFTQFF